MNDEFYRLKHVDDNIKVIDEKALEIIMSKIEANLSKKMDPTIRMTIQSGDKNLWSTNEIASYLKISKRTVEKLTKRPDFPAAVRLPTSSRHRAFRRWYVKDVIDYFTGFLEPVNIPDPDDCGPDPERRQS